MRQCKPKPCRTCKNEFQPMNSLQIVCSPECAYKRVTAINEQNDTRARKKEERRKKRVILSKKEGLRTKSWYIKKAQRAFNAFVRKRDEGSVCISCQKPPKKDQAGHYKTTAARPDIGFHPFNNNLQCFHCNVHKSGAIDLYRPNLVKKIGERNVMWLESQQPAQNWTVEDLVEIEEYYKNQLKLIKG